MTEQPKIKFVRQPDGDYIANAAGIAFKVYRCDSPRVMFALTARRITDNADLYPRIGLPWTTMANCRDRASLIVENELGQ